MCQYPDLLPFVGVACQACRVVHFHQQAASLYSCNLRDMLSDLKCGAGLDNQNCTRTNRDIASVHIMLLGAHSAEPLASS